MKTAQARFVEGSTFRHVVVMTSTASLGLMAVFLVDFANLFYISLLGEQELAAAIGYAGTVLFFTTSICIGITIGIVALVSRALGAGSGDKARRLAGAGLAFMVFASLVIVVLLWPLIGPILSLLGAEGRTHEVATGFLRIVLPSMPLLGLGMATSGLLRAVGDARRAMYVTLAGGVVAALLDPLFIFGLDLGVTGAAITTIFSRTTLVLIGLYGSVRVHDMVERPRRSDLADNLRPLAAIAVPAVLTNIATPVGNAVVTAHIAPFGDGAVAGWAIIGRIVPVAFGAIFALSGAVGPIFGQNLGAGRIDRVRATFRDSLVFIIAYTAVICLVLYGASGLVVDLFDATGAARDLVVFFMTVLAVSFAFNGALFVANTAFNNLGHPTLSTLFNWGRATLGTVPFTWLGAKLYAAKGVLIGQAAGSVLFGLGALVAAFIVMKRLQKGASEDADEDAPPLPDHPPAPPFSSGKASV